MTLIDPAFTEPEQNWQPCGSFQRPVAVPASSPDAGTLLCLPAIGEEWLPLIIGCLDQMLIPATWGSISDADMVQVLQWAQLLKLMVSQAGDCPMLAADCGGPGGTPRLSIDGGATWLVLPACFIGPTGATGATGAAGPPGPASIWRMSGCDLQYSNDAGSTWATASGWSIAALQACLSGTPGNPQSVTTAQQACNIAAWLADSVLQGAMAQAATELSAGASLFDAGLAILGVAALLTGVGELAIAAAAAFIFSAGGIGASNLNAAATDLTLRSALRCAIYAAISADGHVTATNYATASTNIAALTYGTPGIIGLLSNFWNGLGFTGINAIQAEGTLYAGDCSSCSGAPLNAAQFNGTDDELVAASDMNFGTSAVSVGMWMKSTQATEGILFEAGAQAGQLPVVFMALNRGGFNCLGLYRTTVNFNWYAGQNAVNIHDGAAHHVVITAASSGTMYIYVDGVQRGSVALPGASVTAGTPSTRFGHSILTATWFVGKMRNLQVWKGTQLSAAQVLAWYNLGPTNASVYGSPSHSWMMNEGSGATARDTASGDDCAWAGSGTHWAAF